jgi:hypothetical protein
VAALSDDFARLVRALHGGFPWASRSIGGGAYKGNGGPKSNLGLWGRGARRRHKGVMPLCGPEVAYAPYLFLNAEGHAP